MGYYIAKIGERKLNEYIGANTIYSCAAHGAFDCEVSPDLEKMVNDDEAIYAIVDAKGVENFLSILKSGNVTGRDVQLITNIIEQNYKEGFIIRG